MINNDRSKVKILNEISLKMPLKYFPNKTNSRREKKITQISMRKRISNWWNTCQRFHDYDHRTTRSNGRIHINNDLFTERFCCFLYWPLHVQFQFELHSSGQITWWLNLLFTSTMLSIFLWLHISYLLSTNAHGMEQLATLSHLSTVTQINTMSSLFKWNVKIALGSSICYDWNCLFVAVLSN